MGRFPSVIKASAFAGTPDRALRTFEFNDVMAEVKKVLVSARDEADAIIEQARREAEVIAETTREQARLEGYEKGQDEGRQAGRSEAFEAAQKEFAEQQKNLIASYKQAVSTINADRTAWKDSAHHDLVDLAMAVARRVAHHVGKTHRQAVLGNLEEAVRLAGARSDVTIAVNAADVDAARSFAKSLTDMQEQWENIRVVAEPDVSPGGCHVHWGSGSIDATLETQLDRIETELSSLADAEGSVSEASKKVSDK